MGKPLVLFARLYRAALLGYLLNGGEVPRARAYDLGRAALADGYSLLDIVRTHSRTINALLEATPDTRRGLARFKAAQDFLLEALSPFDMVGRGYVALLPGHTVVDPHARHARRKRRGVVQPFPMPSRGIT